MNLLLIAVLIALAFISVILIYAYSDIIYNKWKLNRKSGPSTIPANTIHDRIPLFVHVQVTKW
jgi:hypothetical protein